MADDNEGKFRWMLKIGIGAVLIVPIVGWMMVLISSMVESNKDGTVAMTKAADSMDDLTSVVKEAVEEQQELRQDLAPLVRQLDRVADAVRDSVEQHEQAEAQP